MGSIESLTADLKRVFEAESEARSTCVTSHLIEIEEVLNKFQENVDFNKDNLIGFLNDHIENAVNMEHGALTEAVGEAIAINDITKEKVNKLCSEIEIFVEDNKRLVQNFSENEWLTDRPTGMSWLLSFFFFVI
jgi:hypothetical protein